MCSYDEKYYRRATLQSTNAAVTRFAPLDRRGAAYGLFNASFGISWFVGSACFGLLYDISRPALIGVSVILYLIAALVLWSVAHRA